jgi:hypothetical protein
MKKKISKPPPKVKAFTAKENKELSDKIMKGMRIALDKLIVESRIKDESLVFSKDGKIVWIKARDLKLSTEK